MRVALIYPPFVSNQSGPPAGISALGPYLSRNGVDCRLLDLNVEFFWYLWNSWPDLVETIRDRFTRRLARGNLTPSARASLSRHLRLTLPLLDSWRGAFGRELGGQPSEEATLLRQSLFGVAHAYFFNEILGADECLEVTLPEVAHLVRQRAEDPLLLGFLDRYDWRGVDLVGFSLLAQTQLAFSMLFAVALRSKLDGVRTVAGGAYVTEMAAGLSREPETFEYFDLLVVHEGESALLQIVNGQYFHPNVIGPGTDLANHPFCVEDIGALPDQDFSQFKLDLYRPWGLSLPLYSSKGCTWGRCAFCSVNFLCYRERDTTAFFEFALRAARATGIHEIQLVDEDVTPERLRKLAELAISAGTGNSLRWFLQTRFYPALDRDLLEKLARGGFSTIEFGLESADRHTLKITRKGISLPIVRRIVADCEAAGIKVILNFMIGFPWESEESADKAVEFVDEVTKQHPGLDVSCNTQAVKVYVHSDMYRTPERYGTELAEPLPLSPTTRWTGPAWVPDFVGRHRQHLLFSRQSSAEPSSIPGAGLLADLDPHIALAPTWRYLASVRSPAEVAEWEAGPLLVNASSEIGEVLRINPTLNAVLEELRDGCRISLLKERFLNHYPGLDRDQVSNALGDFLVMLNRMHALAFRAA